MTSLSSGLKYRHFPWLYVNPSCRKNECLEFMTPIQPVSPQKASPDQCKHPRVQVVSRDEEAEYVECKECGEVFESSEFKDMAIEELKNRDEEE